MFLVIAGRAKVTTRNFPASLAGLAANVVLIVVLVPAWGIAGAGIALCGAYVVMLTVMYLLTRGAFRFSSSGRGWRGWCWLWAALRPPVIWCCPPTARSGC